MALSHVFYCFEFDWQTNFVVAVKTIHGLKLNIPWADFRKV